jgi:hypothetical protein
MRSLRSACLRETVLRRICPAVNYFFRRSRGMKSVIEACLVGSIMIAGAGALFSQKPC